MAAILYFRDPLATQPAEIGGKGANLARLTQAGFPVPPGFILPAQLFRDFISAAPDLFPHLAKLPTHDPAALASEAAALRCELGKLPLPANLSPELHAALAEFPPEQAFSVRSSSTLEDLALAAFAGQHETVLNCVGEDRILAAIKDCFLSLIAYRAQLKFPHEQAAMAVVVQQMIPCEVAGVAFTINPVSGDLSELLINSNLGLGESVVSGEAPIDQFALDKSTKAIRTQQLARKSYKVVSAAGGTTQVALSPAESSAPSLTPDQLAHIADLALRVESHYHFPQDIEWGIANNQVFLLQSRPITTIPPRWTRDESAERFPTAITPLTWDFVEDGFHRSLAFSLRLMGVPPFQGKWFAMFDHYIYGNQNAVDLYLKRIPLRLESLEQLEAVIPLLRQNYRWVQELPLLWSRDLDYYLIRIGEFMAQPLDSQPLPTLWHYVKEICEFGAHYFQPNIAISITQSLLHRVLLQLLLLTVGPADASRLHDSLLAFCETKTGMINAELYALAAHVRRTPALLQVFREHASREIVEQKLIPPFREFSIQFDTFLRVHGHREVEFDAYHPTWIEIPWVVLDHIRLLLEASDALSPAQREHELRLRMHKAELELFARVSSSLHFFFHEIIRLARAYTSLDDLEHYQTTRLTLPLRKGLREVGRRLHIRGVLGDARDIFFAHATPLEQAIQANDDGQWRTLGESIRVEKELYLRHGQQSPPWIPKAVARENGVQPAALEESLDQTLPASGQTEDRPMDHLSRTSEDSPSATGATTVLSGLPGSPGQATGPVFQVRSMDDFAAFPKGAVLIARTTNPTWTPLFYNAVAVVTESGGPLSHGAVTAREMQIPAVMSVRDCMSALKNGDTVQVDGSRGQVTFLKR
jgi:phosphohistidine swiveling domain-containing protein